MTDFRFPHRIHPEGFGDPTQTSDLAAPSEMARSELTLTHMCSTGPPGLHPTNFFTTFPCTSVRRKSRPWKRYVNCV